MFVALCDALDGPAWLLEDEPAALVDVEEEVVAIRDAGPRFLLKTTVGVVASAAVDAAIPALVSGLC